MGGRDSRFISVWFIFIFFAIWHDIEWKLLLWGLLNSVFYVIEAFSKRIAPIVKKQFNFKNKDVLELVASVTNAYNRNNIFYVNRTTSKKIYQFPILPSFGLSYKF